MSDKENVYECYDELLTNAETELSTHGLIMFLEACYGVLREHGYENDYNRCKYYLNLFKRKGDDK
jgi:hypothetical protein